MRKTYKLLLVFIIIGCNSLFAQENEGSSEASEASESEEFKHFRAAFSIGHGFIPQADSKNSDLLIIPTLALEFQYWFNSKWGIALQSDLEIANYIVELENDMGNEIERENPLIIAVPVHFSPWDNGLAFIAGPGIEFEDSENFSIFRLGVGYEFEFGNEWDFAPEFIYDLKSGSINSFTIAFGVGKRF